MNMKVGGWKILLIFGSMLLFLNVVQPEPGGGFEAIVGFVFWVLLMLEMVYSHSTPYKEQPEYEFQILPDEYVGFIEPDHADMSPSNLLKIAFFCFRRGQREKALAYRKYLLVRWPSSEEADELRNRLERVET
jgi:hypothetical protein